MSQKILKCLKINFFIFNALKVDFWHFPKLGLKFDMVKCQSILFVEILTQGNLKVSPDRESIAT